MEFEITSQSQKTHKNTVQMSTTTVENVVPNEAVEEQVEEQYSLARDKSRRTVQPPQYGYQILLCSLCQL